MEFFKGSEHYGVKETISLFGQMAIALPRGIAYFEYQED